MRDTIILKNKPSIINTYTIAGPKESQGPLKKYIHKKLTDDSFGADTYEKAECKILSFAIKNLIKKQSLEENEIGALFSGDLLNQIISASFAARDFDMPYIGIYNACATMSEAIGIASVFVDGEYFDNAVCATGSHFATAERQYRFPLELGCTRPPQAQWTVTGAGACLIGKHDDNYPSVTSVTFGKVVDFGVTDLNNMGAAMCPSAVSVLMRHFKCTGTKPEDYDLIVTGDLGVLGSRLFKELMWEKGFDVNKQHVDCGEMIYQIEEDEYQGGSGAGCSAIVFNSYIYKKMLGKKLNKVILMATGALMSTVSAQQGESIPCITHLVTIENSLKQTQKD